MADGVEQSYDVIVVGGGSAGSVLASRLSEDASRRVLLVEAGKDTPPGNEPADVLDTYYSSLYNPKNFWPALKVHWQGPEHRGSAPPVGYSQARILGGGSSVNALVGPRGFPADFAAWTAMGASGWDWDGVLPYYRKLETDLDFDGPLHGKSGPIPLRRNSPDNWPPFCRAMVKVLERRQYRFVPDMNDLPREGYTVVPTTSRPTHRVSSAIGYLTAEVRARPNLSILTETHVERLEFSGKRVTGIVAKRDGRSERFAAREVILSAGALHSPAMLMRAGIGPAKALKALGISVLADRPGVGQNLQEHPTVALGTLQTKEGRQSGDAKRSANMSLRYSSGLPGCDPSDMYITFMNKSSWHPLGRQIAAVAVVLNQPHSRGQMTIQSADPYAEPLVEFNILSDPRDYQRLRDGLLMIHDFFQEPEPRALSHALLVASFSERVRRLGRPTTLNWLLSGIAAAFMNSPAPLREFLLRRFIAPDADPADILPDPKRLEAWIRANATGFFHPVGTCRIGAPDDPLAVVDPSARVIGVEGLRVVDASIMPVIVHANTNVTTMMIAEKVADTIRKGG